MYRRKGQSIVEYVLVLAAIVAAIALAVNRFVWGTGGDETENDGGLQDVFTSRLSSDIVQDVSGNLGLYE